MTSCVTDLVCLIRELIRRQQALEVASWLPKQLLVVCNTDELSATMKTKQTPLFVDRYSSECSLWQSLKTLKLRRSIE